MAWKAEFILLIVFTTLVSYGSALAIRKSTQPNKRKAFLILSILISLGVLFTFKYYNFFIQSINEGIISLGIGISLPTARLLLPIGISFYTFQTVSYVVDVYQDRIEPEKHLGFFALYISFFPQLIAGPIERPARLLPQLKKEQTFEHKRVVNGLLLMLWGFFKKLVIADRLAIIVNTIYQTPEEHTSAALIIATYFAGYQIYCDFSGYTDIARGAARILGIDLVRNFRFPYAARSIPEFWQRWHISLTNWFRDYIYLPLTRKRIKRGGNTALKKLFDYNLLLVFLISGLWHGADWNFIIWGGLHGLYLVISNWIDLIRPKIQSIFGFDEFPSLKNLIRVFFTFNLVSFTWIFFRANDLSHAVDILKNIFSLEAVRGFSLSNLILNFYDYKIEIIIALCAIVLLEIVQSMDRVKPVLNYIAERPIWVRWTLYLGLVLIVLNFAKASEIPFIYFQF